MFLDMLKTLTYEHIKILFLLKEASNELFLYKSGDLELAIQFQKEKEQEKLYFPDNDEKSDPISVMRSRALLEIRDKCILFDYFFGDLKRQELIDDGNGLFITELGQELLKFIKENPEDSD